MNALQKILQEIELGRERLRDAHWHAKRRGRVVPVRPEELAHLAELCLREVAATAPPPAAPPASAPPAYTWIRC